MLGPRFSMAARDGKEVTLSSAGMVKLICESCDTELMHIQFVNDDRCRGLNQNVKMFAKCPCGQFSNIVTTTQKFFPGAASDHLIFDILTDEQPDVTDVCFLVHKKHE